GDKDLVLTSNELSDFGEIDEYARRTLTPRDEDDLRVRPLFEALLHVTEAGAASPLHLDHANRKAIAVGDAFPTFGERAADDHDDFVSRGGEVDDRRFH